MDEQQMQIKRYTVADVAAAIGVNERTVRRWIADGELRAIRFGGRTGYRITPPDLSAFETRRTVTGDLARHLLEQAGA